jgi:bifunctional non-homologous end joining protein LigD
MSGNHAETLRVDGHEVNITRPEKVLFPEDGITKRDLIRYYERISAWMLPTSKTALSRCNVSPTASTKQAFFQKAAAPYYPAWIRKVTVRKAGGTVRQVVCDDPAALVYLANHVSRHICG